MFLLDFSNYFPVILPKFPSFWCFYYKLSKNMVVLVENFLKMPLAKNENAVVVLCKRKIFL